MSTTAAITASATSSSQSATEILEELFVPEQLSQCLRSHARVIGTIVLADMVRRLNIVSMRHLRFVDLTHSQRASALQKHGHHKAMAAIQRDLRLLFGTTAQAWVALLKWLRAVLPSWEHPQDLAWLVEFLIAERFVEASSIVHHPALMRELATTCDTLYTLVQPDSGQPNSLLAPWDVRLLTYIFLQGRSLPRSSMMRDLHMLWKEGMSMRRNGLFAILVYVTVIHLNAVLPKLQEQKESLHLQHLAWPEDTYGVTLDTLARIYIMLQTFHQAFPRGFPVTDAAVAAVDLNYVPKEDTKENQRAAVLKMLSSVHRAPLQDDAKALFPRAPTTPPRRTSPTGLWNAAFWSPWRPQSKQSPEAFEPSAVPSTQKALPTSPPPQQQKQAAKRKPSQKPSQGSPQQLPRKPRRSSRRAVAKSGPPPPLVTVLAKRRITPPDSPPVSPATPPQETSPNKRQRIAAVQAH